MIGIELSFSGAKLINSKDFPKTIREHKGKSLIEIPKDFTIIDIETTGLDTFFDEIIEIGALKIRNNEISDTFQTLVKPNEPICSFITNLTGITNEMLNDAPKIKNIFKNFADFIGNDILMGYNINFDINFLYDNAIKCKSNYISNNFIDIMRFARKIYPDLHNHKLITVAKNLNVDINNSHRALKDCNITYECFKKIRENIIENNIYVKEWFNYSVDLRNLKSERTEFDETNPFYKKYCVFTGKLEKMIRKDAGQLVVDLGGYCENNVTKKSNFLILGNNDYCSTIKDGKSSKQKKAEQYILEGQDLQVISENTFYDMLEIY